MSDPGHFATLGRSRIPQEHTTFAVRKLESETPAGGVCRNSERDRFAHAAAHWRLIHEK
jgi:hypothetical protein